MAKKKVNVEKFGIVHYHAGCDFCDFSSAIGESKSTADVRSSVRKHVIETGHSVWIESGIHFKYRLQIQNEN